MSDDDGGSPESTMTLSRDMLLRIELSIKPRSHESTLAVTD